MGLDAKFVFVLDGYKRKYLAQLHLALHSLRTRGGRAAGMECVLLYVGEPEPRIESFCREHELTLQFEKPLFPDGRWNKLLMSRVTRGDVVCLLDLDVLFAGDPTPVLELSSREQAFCAAEAGHTPQRHLSNSPWLSWWDRPFRAAGWREWEKLFQRHGRGLDPPPSVLSSRIGQKMLPNYNSGVLISPPGLLPELGHHWEAVTRELAAARSDPSSALARYLRLDHTNQISLGVAVHAAGIPWRPLDYRYHFAPLHTRDPAKREALLAGEVALVHYPGPQQAYLLPEASGPRRPEHAEYYDLARVIVREAGPMKSEDEV